MSSLSVCLSVFLSDLRTFNRETDNRGTVKRGQLMDGD